MRRDAAEDFPGIELRNVAPCRIEAGTPEMSQSAGRLPCPLIAFRA
jgi:hypothetical protein